MSISQADILKIATLARIHVTPADLPVLEKKFHSLLEYFNFLQEADTTGVQPLFHGIEQLELREDIPEASLDREKLLQNAPDQMENCFKLPRVVGEAE